MVKVYVRKILDSNGKYTLDDVPKRWRDAVQEELEKRTEK